MQSSPPIRAWARRDSQGSQYSLDLGALDLDGQDDTDTRIPHPQVDRIFSEDIDGPSDFTQNMDMWMRGGTVAKRASKKMTRNVDYAAQKIDTRHEDEAPPKKMEEEHEPLMVLPKQGDEVEDRESGSHHTPKNSPSKGSVLENTQHEEQFSSEWQTDGEGSTPQPPVHKQFLQPTVEDYYSELTTARQASFALSARSHAFDTARAVQKQLRTGDKEPTPGRASSPTISPVRSPVLQRTSNNNSYEREPDNESRLPMETEFRQLDARCQQLGHLNDALSRALEEERRGRKQDKLYHESGSAEAARREQDLVEMKELAHRHNDAFRREFVQLKEKLLDQKTKESTESKHGVEQCDHASELQELRADMERQKLQDRLQIRALQHDLELTRKAVSEAKNDARVLREELNEDHDLHQAETERLGIELQQAHEDEAAIAELEREVKDSRAEIERLRSANAESVDQMNTVKDQLAAMKNSHNQDISRTTMERSRAVELAASLQRQLQDLRKQLRDEQTAHVAEMGRLKSQQETSGNTSSQELAVMRAELEAKQSEINTVILDRNDAHDSLQAATAQNKDLQAKLSDLESINAALDTRVSEALRQREKYWRDKFEAVKRERELMAKALLHQWGQDEVGVGHPQIYAYKYLQKDDDTSKETREKDGGKAQIRSGSVV